LRLLKFCQWAGKTPTELIEQRKKEIDNWDPKARTMEDVRNEYLEYLSTTCKKCGKKVSGDICKCGGSPPSGNTIGTGHDPAIRGFFRKVLGGHYRLNVGTWKGVGEEAVTDKELSLADIKRMLEFCDLEDKLRILWMTQNGQSSEEGRIRPYCLRHFFETVMDTAGYSEYADYIMGHKMPGVKGSYFKPTNAQMVEVWENVKRHLNPLAMANANNLKRNIDAQMTDFAKVLLEAWMRSDPEGCSKLMKEIMSTKLSLEYDPTELRPAIYILQDACKKVTEGQDEQED